ncbi:MAG: surface-adhesin E family protein [Smithellaceae bacterium]
MKNKFQLPLLLLMIVFLSFPSICFSEQPNPKIWKYFGYNSYYNIKILRITPGIPLVWTYKIVTDDTREKTIEKVKKYDLDKSIKYKDYHHDCLLWEIDCKQRLIRVKDYIEFDKNDIVLNRYRFNNNEWDSIVTNSMGDTLYNKVCVTQAKPVKKKK